MSDERPMPQNIAAERAVLGSMLIPGTPAYERVVPMLDVTDFATDEHKIIYRALLTFEGKGADLLTVRESLKANSKLEKAGGSAYLSGLIDQIPDVANVERYARMVREASLRRRAIVECSRLSAAAYSGEPISELAANGALLFSDIAASRDDGPRAIRDIAKRTAAELEARIANGHWMTGIATGVSRLDAYTLGLQRGVESIIGARPRVGKTALAIALAMTAADAGHRVMFVQLDMSERMLGNRILAARAGVSSFKIRSGRFLDAEEMQRIAKATAELTKLTDRIITVTEREIAKLVAIIRREAQSNGLDMVLIDHVGHVQGRGEKRYLEIGNVSSRLIEVASETNAAIVVLAQLNRDAEERAPSLADLRESGNLEQDARLVVLLDRPSLRDSKKPECQLNLLVPKNEGETGTDITAHFNLPIQRVTETADMRCRHCSESDGPSREEPQSLWDDNDRRTA